MRMSRMPALAILAVFATGLSVQGARLSSELKEFLF